MSLTPTYTQPDSFLNPENVQPELLTCPQNHPKPNEKDELSCFIIIVRPMPHMPKAQKTIPHRRYKWVWRFLGVREGCIKRGVASNNVQEGILKGNSEKRKGGCLLGSDTH